MHLDNWQHLVNLASEQQSKNYALESMIWIWHTTANHYVECYARLRANLLFLFELNTIGNKSDFSLFGVYILERFRVVDEASTAVVVNDEASDLLQHQPPAAGTAALHRLHRQQLQRFSLLFVDSGESVRLAVDSPGEKSVWVDALSKCCSVTS